MVSPQGETQQTALVLLAIILVIGISYLLFTIAIKLFGIALFLIGLWLLVWHPEIARYQHTPFTKVAMATGLLFIIVGLAMVVFW